MKTKILSLITFIFAAITLSSCNEGWNPQPNSDKNGQVSLTSMGVEVSNAEQVISRLAVDLSDYIVTIYDAKNSVSAEWKYSEMPEIFTLPVGDYKITVKSHNVEKAAWDKPYFLGTKTFSIQDSKITDIGVIKCVLSNIKVSIKFDSSIVPYLGADVKVVVVANDEGSLIFTKDETRSGYFEAIEGSSTLVATLTGTVSGYYETVVNTYTDVVVEDLNNDVTTGEDVIPGDRPGKEDPKDPDPEPGPGPDPEPSVDPITFTSETLSFDEVNTPAEGVNYIVNIHSEAGLAHLIVEIISNDLTDEMLQGVGLAANFDLAYPGSLEEALRDSFGFPVGDKVIGQKDIVFNITQFVPLLNIYQGTHKFKLTATDANNVQVVKTLTFVVQ